MNSFTQFKSPHPTCTPRPVSPIHIEDLEIPEKQESGPLFSELDWIPSQPLLASAALEPGRPDGFQVPFMHICSYIKYLKTFAGNSLMSS